MNLLIFSDIHDNYVHVEKIAEDLKKADAIIIAGDITHFGHKEKAEQIIKSFAVYNNKILAVPGNCDYPDVENILSINDWSIHKKIKNINGYSFFGIGGSLPCPGKTPNEFTEEQFDQFAQELKNQLQTEAHKILITHQPPFNTNVDKINTNNVGSKSLRKLIEEVQPLLVISGHIHEAQGTDEIGNSKIINPGPFKEGHYAFIKLIDTQCITLEFKKI